MAKDTLVDVCISCGTAKVHKGQKVEWETNGDWGDSCGSCGAPVVTCKKKDIKRVFNSQNQDNGTSL